MVLASCLLSADFLVVPDVMKTNRSMGSSKLLHRSLNFILSVDISGYHEFTTGNFLFTPSMLVPFKWMLVNFSQEFSTGQRTRILLSARCLSSLTFSWFCNITSTTIIEIPARKHSRHFSLLHSFIISTVIAANWKSRIDDTVHFGGSIWLDLTDILVWSWNYRFHLTWWQNRLQPNKVGSLLSYQKGNSFMYPHIVFWYVFNIEVVLSIVISQVLYFVYMSLFVHV